MIAILLAFTSLGAGAQDDGALMIEVIPQFDDAGKAYLPHNKPFDLRFTNRSDRPLKFWDEHCQPEHGTLSFGVKDATGSTICRKRAVEDNPWGRFPPKTFTIAPGEAVLRKINFSDFFWGHLAWQNAPEPNSGEPIEVRAVLEIKPGKEAAEHGVWTGRVESPPIIVLVVDPRLKTPHEYLWNDCPKMALRMMKEDPTWVNRKDPKDECTPLHHAARFGPKEVVAWMIEHQADVNAAAYNQFTPLHFALTREIADILIKAGAKLDQKDSWGKTPLQSAAEERRMHIVDAILDSGYKLDLATAIRIGKRDLVFKMLAENPKIVVGGDGGADLGGNTTPLGLAASQGDLVLVRLLLEAGAPINDSTEMPNAGGPATPLCNAVWAGHADVVEFLLGKGAALDAVGGKFFRTITDFAEEHSDPRIVKLLRQYASNPPRKHERPENILNRLPTRIKAGEFKMPSLEENR
jgi:ankyrin repeat protein